MPWDETLFKSQKEAPKPKGVVVSRRKLASALAAPTKIGQSDMSRIRGGTEGGGAPAATVRAPKDEGARQARVARMREIDEAKQRSNIATTETELMKQFADGETRTVAQQKRDEEEDEVKKMNSMVLYSQCVTVRDAQLEEKEAIRELEEEEDRRMDMMMEVDRVNALRMYEERERVRAEERIKGAKVLKEQIAARARKAELEKETLEREKLQIQKEIRRQEQVQLQAIEAKARANAELMREVAEHNEEQIRRRAELAELEKLDDMQIAAWTAERDARLQAELDERERIAKEKELETARLRAQQEKFADLAAERDEIRARRAGEKNEREWRERERKQAERVAATNAALHAAREEQRLMKIQMVAEAAEESKQEYLRILAIHKAEVAREAEYEKEVAARRIQNKAALISQIQDHEEETRRARQDFLEEGKKLKQEKVLRDKKIQAIRQNKVNQLKSAGVPTKYVVELEKAKFEPKL